MEQEEKKRHHISIKWSIFGYLLIFLAVLIALLWVMQTVYLDRFYKAIKKQELKKAMAEITDVIGDTEYKDELDTIAKNYDIHITMSDEEGNSLYTTGSSAAQHLIRLGTMELMQLYSMAESDGEVQISSKNGLLDGEKNDKDHESFAPPEYYDKGAAPEREKSEGSGSDGSKGKGGFLAERDTQSGKNQPDGQDVKDMFDIPSDSTMETMLIAKIITNKKQNYLLTANSLVTPVNATVYALRIQLVYISAIMLVLSLIMAFLISGHISKPIIRINRTARKISKGDFNVEFDAGGYREIAQMSETLNYTVDELTKSERLQRELIANVSHDLRTPLTMIEAYAEVMRDIPGENNPENVQVIIDETKRLTNLVNDLLDVSKLQAGVLTAEMKEYNLTRGIGKVMERYAKLKEQDGYNIEFVNDGRDVFVEADEFKVYQVVYNLVNNAINYTGDDKKVTVKQIIAGDIVRIEVTDTGPGIPKKELKNVWERYYKVDKTHKRAVMGTGLGLNIVKKILMLHHAQYGVSSTEGKGSTFWFELKIKKIEE